MRVDEEEIKDGKYCPAKYVLTHVNVSLWTNCRVRHDCSIFFTQLLFLTCQKSAGKIRRGSEGEEMLERGNNYTILSRLEVKGGCASQDGETKPPTNQPLPVPPEALLLPR